MKYGFPRGDLKVTVNGVRIRPALALGGWVAFKRTGTNESMVMGDLVLTEAEVSAMISALQQKDVQQNAVHNHLLRETPRVVYVHIAAHGDAATIAAAIRAAPGPHEDSPACDAGRCRSSSTLHLSIGRSATAEK